MLDSDSSPDEDRPLENLLEISPADFEERVRQWLVANEPGGLKEFRVQHLEMVSGAGGEYEIDVTAEFIIFGGARICILVECKHQKARVKREQVMILEAKLRDTGSHKGIVFSTSGFQKGAVEFARVRGIATVTVWDGPPVYSSSISQRLK